MSRKSIPVTLMILLALTVVWPMSGTRAANATDLSAPTATPSMWVTLTAPNGGETLTAGQVVRITWQSSPNIDKVTLGYKSCPSCLDWIATNIPNTGYYDWSVFVGNTINTQFTIEIIAYDTGVGSVIDVSDAAFTVLPGPTPTAAPTATGTGGIWVTLTAPNGGEVLAIGDTYRITWNSDPRIDMVTVGYKACASCLDWIAYDIPNVGYVDWNVSVAYPSVTQYTIEIIAYDTGVGSVVDVSDAPFTVLPPTPTPTFTSTPTFTPTPTNTPTFTPVPQLNAPSLIAPINGQVVTNQRPVFDWSDVSGATGYTIVVSKSSDFSSPVINANVVKSTYTPAIKLARGTTYYWEVRAFGNIAPSNWATNWFKEK